MATMPPVAAFVKHFESLMFSVMLLKSFSSININSALISGNTQRATIEDVMYLPAVAEITANESNTTSDISPKSLPNIGDNVPADNLAVRKVIMLYEPTTLHVVDIYTTKNDVTIPKNHIRNLQDPDVIPDKLLNRPEPDMVPHNPRQHDALNMFIPMLVYVLHIIGIPTDPARDSPDISSPNPWA